MKPKVMSEFVAFLKEFRVIATGIGLVLALAINDLVKSFIDNLVMPTITPLNGRWETATLSIGPVNIGWGLFLSGLLKFIILALIVFIIVKKLMKYSPAK